PHAPLHPRSLPPFPTRRSSDLIGAGMGGLAAAAALRRVGIDVTVYEQAAQFIRLGAGIQIGCNAMKVLRGLGLESRLREQSFYPDRKSTRLNSSHLGISYAVFC